MFTPKQNDELCRIISERPRSIRDLALLSLAYTQNHAMLMEWRQVAPRPVRFRCFDNFEPRPIVLVLSYVRTVQCTVVGSVFQYTVTVCSFIMIDDVLYV